MIVEIRNLVKRYGDFLALDHANIGIREGKIFGLLGPNGAGKTTMIHTMIGLTKVDSGEIQIFGKHMKHHEREIKQDIGIVPQDIAVLEDLTAYENVLFFGRLYGLKGSSLKEGAEEALNFTGLWDRRKDFPNRYSGGMKRRLNIACAIVHQPKLIIMDEPTVGIDPQSRKHILQSVKELNQKGSTIIYTSHYMEEVEEICTEIAIMDHGKVIASGTKEELKSMISSEDKLMIDLSEVSYSIIEKIKKLQGVKECVCNEKQLTVICQRGSNIWRKIIEIIGETGSEVSAFNIEKPTLESVFLTLTGRTLRN